MLLETFENNSFGRSCAHTVMIHVQRNSFNERRAVDHRKGEQRRGADPAMLREAAVFKV